ncbi:amidophosphoribosyltransferase [Methanohalobium evestigatum Z-7303]|uniref:Amidophosphoribosyltransferase n=1 Tax=Methanohalobium evestigatum (strain ATCC BAA-1072 / DSM 3721 / NBRC 107634 / OCM 161 / Z-7303) TaxID=644295 RepID=D7E694_METEZ|nr:amidophosphoribosyltransferase [Methanohalobium evestigatum]ADI73116.1 amidophosphoribosyltransferase [Methanohalobium evestigatum Z-7303]
MKEECGVVGVVLPEAEPQSNSSAFQIYYGLYALQHRGQESTGITIHNGCSANSIKGMGLVPEVYVKDDLKNLTGNVGIGHVRYSTSGNSGIENCQPLVVNFKGGTVAIAHNGNLVNACELRDELESEGRIFITDSDTEVIAHLLVKQLLKHNIFDSIRQVMQRLVGSYSLTILIDGQLIAVRDPLGIKPLCIGEVEGGYAVASESVAIDTLNGKLLRDVYPGEVLFFNDGEIESYQLDNEKRSAHCVFEYIYFARPDSIIDGKLVYKVREKIGRVLADEHPVESDVVSPVPDSGITSAIGYSKESGIKYSEGLMKNRYIGRTFILPGQEMRDIAVRLKMNTISDNIDGERLILIDDSIVRGTTSKRIVNMIRDSGAKEVHARIGSPPIIAPCYLGIDMATREQLIASQNTIEGIRDMIGVDSIGYLSIDGLVEAIGINKNELCLGCLTGRYPVEIYGEECCAHLQSRLSEY